MKLPPAIIFVNNDISSGSLETLTSQLFISEVMDGYEFDDRLAADPNYPFAVHMNGLRIIVKQDMTQDIPTRNIADVVLFVKAGLASVEKNNCGPPGLTLALTNIEVHQLLRYNNSQYTLNLPEPPSYPFIYPQRGFGGIVTIELRDSSGVHLPNPDNEYNNPDFINRR